MLIWGIVGLFIIGFVSCEKKTVEPTEPAEPDPVVVVDTIPEDTLIVTSTLGSGDMASINGLYFGTYNGGYIPNITFIDSVYADIDSLGTTGYSVKIYSDRRLSDKIKEFNVRFQTLAFEPCDIGLPNIYFESRNGCGYFEETRRLEVLDCNSIDLSIGTYGSGRGGCPSYKTYRFEGSRLL